MKIAILFIFCIASPYLLQAQFPPAAGQYGSTAISADSNVFVAWATQCQIVRGFLSVADTSISDLGSNYASYGSDTDATGSPDNIVASLGDSGIAVLTFDEPIVDGPGFDFAVFENGFTDGFLELAFVEVSSDGANFFRFPSISLSDTTIQTPAFGETDPTKINNLAGKYRSLFGTPFDLADLPDSPLLDKHQISYVRIVDVIGSIDPQFACRDSEGHIINDPWPTPFSSSGFDLDAVGVIFNQSNNAISDVEKIVTIFPNPASDEVTIIPQNSSIMDIQIADFSGRVLMEYLAQRDKISIDISSLMPGVYIIRIFENSNTITYRLVVQ